MRCIVAEGNAGTDKTADEAKRGFTLHYTKPASRQPAASGEPSETPVSTGVEGAQAALHEKKQPTRIINSLLGSAAFTIFLSAVLLLNLQVDSLLVAALALPMFTGFAILFYNFLEVRE